MHLLLSVHCKHIRLDQFTAYKSLCQSSSSLDSCTQPFLYSQQVVPHPREQRYTSCLMVSAQYDEPQCDMLHLYYWKYMLGDYILWGEGVKLNNRSSLAGLTFTYMI